MADIQNNTELAAAIEATLKERGPITRAEIISAMVRAGHTWEPLSFGENLDMLVALGQVTRTTASRPYGAHARAFYALACDSSKPAVRRDRGGA